MQIALADKRGERFAELGGIFQKQELRLSLIYESSYSKFTLICVTPVGLWKQIPIPEIKHIIF